VKTRGHLRGDLFGGVTAAVIALPLALAFGVLTFAPLGPEHASQGALAGLYGAIFTGIFAALFGGTAVQITGPTGPMTVVMTSLVSRLLQAGYQPPDLFGPLFMCVFLGGLVQILLGAWGAGRLIKFIPYPVIAGFMNGIAVIIFVGQLRPFLGLAEGASLLDILTLKAPVQPATLAVGAFTVAVVVLFPRLTRALPGSLAGLVLGSAAYHALRAVAGPESLGPVVGHIPSQVPLPVYLGTFARELVSGELVADLPVLLGPALALGVLGSIDSLLTSVVADTVTRTRHDSRRELLGQGLGNMAAAAFGGLAGAGATVRTLVNINAGGRTRLSGVIHGLTLLGVVVALGPVAGQIPMVVLAGILLVTAARMVDEWSRNLLWKLTGTAEQKREIAINLGVVLLVTVVTVAVDLMVAVGLGVLVAGALFVEKMSRGVIKHVFRGDVLRSRRVYPPDALAILEAQGRRMAIFELQGPLFFGSADALARAVDREAGDAEIVLLDMRQVSEIDASGARVLELLQEMLSDRGQVLVLCHLRPEGPRWGFLQDLGILGKIQVFPDRDSALEWGELRILSAAGSQIEAELPLAALDIVRGLTAGQVETLAGYLERRTYAAGELILRRGDPPEAMYVLAGGRADITVPHPVDGRPFRVAAYGPGAVLGEMALLEGRGRTADVCAQADTVAYRLSAEALRRLGAEHPDLANRLLWNLARELAVRLRATAAEVQVLES
jgi:SulP family sulfate permease